MVLGKLDGDIQKNGTGPLIQKMNPKWMKNLNVRQEIIKILEENTGHNLFDISHSNFLLAMSPETGEIKAKMNNWDFKIKSFCTAKEIINKLKSTFRMGEDICKSHI